jgi:hypothetical protein
MTPKWLLGALVAGLALGVLVWMPSRALSPLLPGALQCSAWRGTVWRGACENLQWQRVSTGDIRWAMRAPSSIAVLPELELQWRRADSQLSTRLLVTGLRALRLEILRADLAFATLRESLPGTVTSQWSLPRAGRLQLDGVSVTLQSAGDGVWAPTHLSGTVRGRDLAAPATMMPLGDFEAVLEQGAKDPAPIVARLRDLGGPLSLRGELVWQPGEGRYRINAQVRGRTAATRQLLENLGPAAADGSRELSLEGEI